MLMYSIKKRVAVAFSVIVLALGAALTGAQPAQASSVFGCGDGWICFYNWESFATGGGVWGHRISGAYGGWNVCITMPTSGTSFPGGTAYNAATSILINNSGTNVQDTYSHFYDDNNCQLKILGEYTDSGTVDTDMWRLANYSGNPNDRIGSYKLSSNP